jgi:nucleoside-diphosphate-sugar epimerase
MNTISRTLITGGSGLLGSVVVDALIGHQVVVFDIAKPHQDVEFIHGSVTDFAELEKAAAGARAIVHIAALLPRGNAQEEIFRVNAVGTWNALQAAEACGCETFVLISSECATGLCFQKDERPPLALPVNEEHPLRPTDAYSTSKQVAETIALAFARRSNMRIVILRPLYILFDNQAATIPARQDVWHHDLWGYVDPLDVGLAVEAALSNPEARGIYFLGAPDTLCETPTIELVEQRFGKLPDSLDHRIYEARPTAAIFDNRRARAELGIDFRSSWRTKISSQ